MTVDLLAVIQAEAQADALLQEAQIRREILLKQAQAERAQRLAEIKPPVIDLPTLAPLRPDLEKLKTAAKRNKAAAIKRILEELHAS